MKPGQYGNFYFCVTHRSRNRYLFADKVEVTPSGALTFYYTNKKGQEILNLALPPGEWAECYSASLLDGAPVAEQEVRWEESK